MKAIIIIATALIVFICAIVVQPEPAYQNQIDAVVVLPDGSPTKFFLPQIESVIEPEPLRNLEILQNYLKNDTISEREYIPEGENTYVCVHFAVDLAKNLAKDGYYSGVVVRSAKRHPQTGHILAWVKMNPDFFVINAGNDSIYPAEDFNATVDRDLYVLRYQSIESGVRKANEEYQRRM